MAKSDHLVVRYCGYTHHAIDLGDGSVIEYGGKGAERLVVRRMPLAEFCRRGSVFIRQYPSGTTLPPDYVILLALSRLGEERYDILRNNCEHLATWCKTGRHESAQAERVTEYLLAGMIVCAITMLSKSSR